MGNKVDIEDRTARNTNQTGIVSHGQKDSTYSHIKQGWQGELSKNCIVK